MQTTIGVFHVEQSTFILVPTMSIAHASTGNGEVWNYAPYYQILEVYDKNGTRKRWIPFRIRTTTNISSSRTLRCMVDCDENDDENDDSADDDVEFFIGTVRTIEPISWTSLLQSDKFYLFDRAITRSNKNRRKFYLLDRAITRSKV